MLLSATATSSAPSISEYILAWCFPRYPMPITPTFTDTYLSQVYFEDILHYLTGFQQGSLPDVYTKFCKFFRSETRWNLYISGQDLSISAGLYYSITMQDIVHNGFFKTFPVFHHASADLIS